MPRPGAGGSGPSRAHSSRGTRPAPGTCSCEQISSTGSGTHLFCILFQSAASAPLFVPHTAFTHTLTRLEPEAERCAGSASSMGWCQNTSFFQISFSGKIKGKLKLHLLPSPHSEHGRDEVASRCHPLGRDPFGPGGLCPPLAAPQALCHRVSATAPRRFQGTGQSAGDWIFALGRLIPAAIPWLGPCLCPSTTSKTTQLPRSVSSPLKEQAAG